MPRRDGTGPMGKGPRTGRGLGNCPIDDKIVIKDFPVGRGQGCGLRRRFRGGW